MEQKKLPQGMRESIELAAEAKRQGISYGVFIAQNSQKQKQTVKTVGKEDAE